MIGGAFYSYGYEIPFIFSGSACLFILPIVIIYFPDDLKESNTTDEDDEFEFSINYYEILKN